MLPWKNGFVTCNILGTHFIVPGTLKKVDVLSSNCILPSGLTGGHILSPPTLAEHKVTLSVPPTFFSPIATKSFGSGSTYKPSAVESTTPLVSSSHNAPSISN